MPVFWIETPTCRYPAIVERGAIGLTTEYLPPKSGRLFVISTEDVWRHQGAALTAALKGVRHELLFLPGGEDQKRLSPLERLADEMVESGADRTSVVIGFGGGIVSDMAGFMAAIFMRGIPVIHIPTTLLGQVDAAIGGKTGVNLVAGKNLIGSVHQPLAVLIDPGLLETLPAREYHSGLYEIIKAGIIRDPALFQYLSDSAGDVLARRAGAVDRIIGDAVRVKAEVVSDDEREADLRRILNFGHTFGHALEAETNYTRFLHGEAVEWGMRAAVGLARLTGHLPEADTACILDLLRRYGPIPPLDGIPAEGLFARLVHDKKTIHGKVHFVLPVRIGEVTIVSGIDDRLVLEAIRSALP